MVVYIGGKAYPDGTTITYTNPGGHGRDRWEEGSTSHANYWIIPAASPPDVATSFSSSSASSSSASNVSSTTVEIDLGYSLINICQPKFIWFECTGLRPNTPHWIFFNGVEVTNFVRTGIDRDTFDAYPKNDPIRNPGDRYLSATSYPSELGGPTAASGPITSSTSGVIYGLFYLQSNETVNFPTGTNLLYALDVSAFRPENSLSLAKGSYTALAQYEYYYENSKPESRSVLRAVGRAFEASISSPAAFGRADYDGGVDYGPANVCTGPGLTGTEKGLTPSQAADAPGCFVAGTIVDMADGSTKKIEDVVIGDKLVGAGGKINTVMEFLHPKLEGKKLYGFNGGKPFVTAEHPFMTADGWKSVDIEATKRENPTTFDLINGYLETGDQILMNDGSYFVIESIEEYSADPDTQLYNFKVDGNNTYIADRFVVHNKGDGGDGCFTPNTLVDMADGSTKKIVDVKIGDKVWNKDKTAINEVKFVEVVDGSEFGYLYSPGNEEPFATVNHPMFINDQIVAGDAEVASYHYPWLTKQYGAIKQLSNVKYKTAPSDLVYNLWLDGDGTYIVNGYGTTSIVGDGGLASIACEKGYLTSEEVVTAMKHSLQHSQELSYGAYLVNKMLGQLNWDPVTKAVSSIIHTLENPNSPLSTALKVIGFAALVVDGKKTLFKKTRSVKTKRST